MDVKLIMVIVGLAFVFSTLVAGAFYLRERRFDNHRLERRLRDLE